MISSYLDDDGDMKRQRRDFISQINNVICYFNKLDTCVLCSLLTSCCNSFYGCELLPLSRGFQDYMEVFLYLLPSVSLCLPLFDEICRRFLNFALTCVNHYLSLICHTNDLVHRCADNLYGINKRHTASFLTKLQLIRKGKLQ